MGQELDNATAEELYCAVMLGETQDVADAAAAMAVYREALEVVLSVVNDPDLEELHDVSPEDVFGKFSDKLYEAAVLVGTVPQQSLGLGSVINSKVTRNRALALRDAALRLKCSRQQEQPCQEGDNVVRANFKPRDAQTDG